MALNDVLNEAEDIVMRLRLLHAEQCRNCGKVYRNVYGTHDRRLGGFWPPRCDYNPVGNDALLTQVKANVSI